MARGHEQGEQLRRELAAHLKIDRNRVGHEWSPGGGRCVTVLAATAEELDAATLYLRGRDAVWRLDDGAGTSRTVDGSRPAEYGSISFQMLTLLCPECHATLRRTDHDRGHEMRIDRTCMNQNCKRVGKPWSELIQKRPAMPERRAIQPYTHQPLRAKAVGCDVPLLTSVAPAEPPKGGARGGKLDLRVSQRVRDELDRELALGEPPKATEREHRPGWLADVDAESFFNVDRVPPLTAATFAEARRLMLEDAGPHGATECVVPPHLADEMRCECAPKQSDPWSTYPDGPVDGMGVVARDCTGDRGTVRADGSGFTVGEQDREDRGHHYAAHHLDSLGGTWRPLKPARVEVGQTWESKGSRLVVDQCDEQDVWFKCDDGHAVRRRPGILLNDDAWTWIPGGES